jgi:hypothetical protein
MHYRAVNKSSLNESDLVKGQLIKVRVDRIELMKRFDLKSLVQTQLITIRASSRVGRGGCKILMGGQ